jgi:hypothetical protein
VTEEAVVPVRNGHVKNLLSDRRKPEEQGLDDRLTNAIEHL